MEILKRVRGLFVSVGAVKRVASEKDGWEPP